MTGRLRPRPYFSVSLVALAILALLAAACGSSKQGSSSTASTASARGASASALAPIHGSPRSSRNPIRPNRRPGDWLSSRQSEARRGTGTGVMPTALDNGQRSPRKLLRAVIARLLGRTR
jgi:hypothetical protein